MSSAHKKNLTIIIPCENVNIKDTKVMSDLMGKVYNKNR